MRPESISANCLGVAIVESGFPSHVPEAIIKRSRTVAFPKAVPLSSGTRSSVTELILNLPAHIALPTAIDATVFPILILKK